MKFLPQAIPDVVLLQPDIHGDDRGYFIETFRQDEFQRAIGYPINFVQDNESKSSFGVLRGLHFQRPPYAQSKLVRVTVGAVLDVAVDIRTGSPNYGQSVCIELSAANKYQLFIPRGFAHGFIVLSETAVFNYKVDHYYAPEAEQGLAYNDPQLAINWQLSASDIKLSDKDNHHPLLSQLNSVFDCQTNYYVQN